MAETNTPQPLSMDVDQFISSLRDGVYQKILVVTGAGISVSCGIPDFRSKQGGLYNTLDCDSIGIPSPELLFDLEFFRIDAAPFYKFAHTLLPSDNIKPSACHRFIAMLESKDKLCRNYTQNVDGLERKAGIKKLVECHGSMAFFKCMHCKKKRPIDAEIIACIRQQTIPLCAKCGDTEEDGMLKPEIIFFGEKLPASFHSTMTADLVPGECDLIIVIGTSLKVGGSVHEILRYMDVSVPRVLINRETVKLLKNIPKGFDLSLLGDCDHVVQYLCDRIGWDLQQTTTSKQSKSAITSTASTAAAASTSSVDGSINVSSNSASSSSDWICSKVDNSVYSITPTSSSSSSSSSSTSSSSSSSSAIDNQSTGKKRKAEDC